MKKTSVTPLRMISDWLRMLHILIKSLPSFQLKSLPLIEWYKREIPLLFKDDKHEFEARNNYNLN